MPPQSPRPRTPTHTHSHTLVDCPQGTSLVDAPFLGEQGVQSVSAGAAGEGGGPAGGDTSSRILCVGKQRVPVQWVRPVPPLQQVLDLIRAREMEEAKEIFTHVTASATNVRAAALPRCDRQAPPQPPLTTLSPPPCGYSNGCAAASTPWSALPSCWHWSSGPGGRRCCRATSTPPKSCASFPTSAAAGTRRGPPPRCPPPRCWPQGWAKAAFRTERRPTSCPSPPRSYPKQRPAQSMAARPQRRT